MLFRRPTCSRRGPDSQTGQGLGSGSLRHGTWGEPGRSRCQIGIRNPGWRSHSAGSGGGGGGARVRSFICFPGGDGQGPQVQVGHTCPLSYSLKRPSPLSLWSSPSWQPCSWLWGWPCWCGSYGRNGRQRAPTGPAVRSSSPTQLRPRPPRTQRRRCGAACPSRSPSSLHLLCLLCDLGGRWSPLWAIKPT